MMRRLVCLAMIAGLLTPRISHAAPAATDARTTHCNAQHGPEPLAPWRFTFPADDGAHAGFASEWWRTFGRVSDDAGRRYDFSTNVSRFVVAACGDALSSESHWAARALVTTTYELLDESTLAVERGTRVEREGPSGAQIARGRLDLQTKTARYVATTGRRTLTLSDGDDRISLVQTKRGAALPLGPKGIMPTGSCVGCGAYAYAYPRVATSGTLRIAGLDHRVSGETWFEHEFAHRELASGDAGWNRYEVQFDDGRDLDARFTRDRTGRFVVTSGVFVNARGAVTYLRDDDARTTNVLGTKWRSVPSGVTYPSLWYLSVPAAHLGLATVEIALDQELRDSLRTPYFSGAIVVEKVGPPEGDREHGFVELTGYGAPISL